jgi:hypothetical protein
VIDTDYKGEKMIKTAFAQEVKQAFPPEGSIPDFIYTLLFALIILGIGSFSLWYAGRLALIRSITLKKAFLITLVGYVTIGAIRTVMIYAGYYQPGMLWFPILMGLILQIILVQQFFNEKIWKSIIAVIVGFIITIVIVIPVFVMAGGLWAYFNTPRG